MRYIVESDLSDFEFWGDTAERNAAKFTYSELSKIGEALDAEYPDMPLTETEVNDIMRDEPGTLAELIGLEWDDEHGDVIRPGDKD